jgi:hypothetical protein
VINSAYDFRKGDRVRIERTDQGLVSGSEFGWVASDPRYPDRVKVKIDNQVVVISFHFSFVKLIGRPISRKE